jgi:hypothetical protein
MEANLAYYGKKFGMLTPVAVFQGEGRWVRWLCVCDCGRLKDYRPILLCNGNTKSCGCLKVIICLSRSKHGYAPRNKSVPEYTSWMHMKSRCGNENNPKFRYWGGRGITICERWKNSFANFLADMGPKPDPALMLDRINNDGNYEPGNCRWATRSQQMLNRRPWKFWKQSKSV